MNTVLMDSYKNPSTTAEWRAGSQGIKTWNSQEHC
jgi:hypothetical protein